MSKELEIEKTKHKYRMKELEYQRETEMMKLDYHRAIEFELRNVQTITLPLKQAPKQQATDEEEDDDDDEEEDERTKASKAKYGRR